MNQSSRLFIVAQDRDAERWSRDDAEWDEDLAQAVELYLRLARSGQHRSAAGRPAKKVLVVDHDVPWAGLLSAFLTLHGFAVLTLSRAEEVVRVAQAFQPDIIIIDLLVDHSRGIELAGLMRQAGFSDTPMVALSSSPAMLSVAVLYARFEAYLEKPLNLNDLVFQLQTLIRS